MIQIIDDNEVNLRLLSTLIERSLNVPTTIFQRSAVALAWARKHEVDLILVDYLMPNLNGLEFIKRYRRHNADVPMVMITASDDRSIRQQALELGANDFLNKPFDKFELVARVKNMLTIRESHKKLAHHAEWLAIEVRKATESLVEQEREVIFRLSRAAEYRSPETGLHVMRVAHYCKALAAEIGLPEDEQELIFAASSMHDIGKVGVPDEILFKEGRLDPYEYAMIKLHTLTGYEIMQNSKSRVLQLAADIALCHHERYDGRGYPRGIKGEAIPIAARICSIADVFDALTSERPYKPAWNEDHALEEMEKRSGQHFDPHLLAQFRSILPTIRQIKERYTERRTGSLEGHAPATIHEFATA